MSSVIINNYKMIHPLPAFWWLGIGYLAQLLYPKTPINVDNMSIASFRMGIVLTVLLALLSLFIASVFYEKRSKESKFLKFLYLSTKQFVELAMAVCGFSAAYFIHIDFCVLASLFIVFSIFLATAINHIFLVVFDEKEIGTLSFALNIDRKYRTDLCSVSVNVVAGIVALGVFSFLAALSLGWLKT